jgi:molecular chaperone IbpA
MTTYLTLDLPTLHRSFVGFDQLFEEINRSFTVSKQDNYPPHNIIRTGDNRYLIEMAVAGFLETELDIETVTNNYGQNVLTIKGERQRSLTTSGSICIAALPHATLSVAFH